jgi:hypothetical protein
MTRMEVVRGGRVEIKVNDQVGPYFTTHAGVRQGDPLSPLLFDVVGDCDAPPFAKGRTPVYLCHSLDQ